MQEKQAAKQEGTEIHVHLPESLKDVACSLRLKLSTRLHTERRRIRLEVFEVRKIRPCFHVPERLPLKEEINYMK